MFITAVALAGCTGQNVDESFLDDHGAVLAQVECPCPTCSTKFDYSATMFLDGSVLAQGHTSADQGLRYLQRGNSENVHGTVAIDHDSACGTPGASYFRIESGDLNLYICSGGPPAHVVDETVDLVNDCTGFNKGLFD